MLASPKAVRRSSLTCTTAVSKHDNANSDADVPFSANVAGKRRASLSGSVAPRQRRASPPSDPTSDKRQSSLIAVGRVSALTNIRSASLSSSSASHHRWVSHGTRPTGTTASRRSSLNMIRKTTVAAPGGTDSLPSLGPLWQ